MPAPKPYRQLAFDTSLGAPGVALIEVSRTGKPKIIDMSHVKTDSKQPIALRLSIVESWATLFIAKHAGKGFDSIGREDFQGRSSHQNFPVFAAWAATEKAVHAFGLSFDKYEWTTQKGKRKADHGVGQGRAKLIVTGSGSATKEEVAEAVRRLTGFDGEFAKDDESDACCIALAYLIEKGVITT